MSDTMTRAEYNELMAVGESAGITQEVFDELSAFAKAKKTRRPKAEWVRESKSTKAPAKAKAKAPKADGFLDLGTGELHVGPSEKPAKKAAAPKAPKPESTRAANKGKTCAHVGEDGKPDCDSPARARELCSKHHTAWYRENVPGAREAARAASAKYAASKRAGKQQATA